MASKETRRVSHIITSGHQPRVLIVISKIRNPTLEFVAAPALAPAEVSVDENLMAQYAAELQRVSHTH